MTVCSSRNAYGEEEKPLVTGVLLMSEQASLSPITTKWMSLRLHGYTSELAAILSSALRF